jgi:thioredoxin-related protein
MKTIRTILLSAVLMSFTGWQTDFEKAKQEARDKHRLILLSFSGSDWCAPCIRMHKDIFDDPRFISMADTYLVMYNADFPRNKKNQPANNIKKQNEALADKYDPEGKFPYTLLLDANGKVIRSWDGLPSENGPQFAQQIKSLCESHP